MRKKIQAAFVPELVGYETLAWRFSKYRVGVYEIRGVVRAFSVFSHVAAGEAIFFSSASLFFLLFCRFYTERDLKVSTGPEFSTSNIVCSVRTKKIMRP